MSDYQNGSTIRCRDFPTEIEKGLKMKNQKVQIDLTELSTIATLRKRVTVLEAELAKAKASAKAWYNVATQRVNRADAAQKGA